MLSDPVINALIDRLRLVMDELRAVGPELGVTEERMEFVAMSVEVEVEEPRRRAVPASHHRPVHAG